MRIRSTGILLIALAALIGAAPARADEADNFTCRARLTRDALAPLDDEVNVRIQAALVRANHAGPGRCDAACLRRLLQRSVGGSERHPMTFIPHATVTRLIKARPDIDRCRLAFRDSIYGARAYDQPWLWPVNRRIIFLADSILVAGHVVGLDKIDHFIREGLVHWRAVSLEGGDIASSIERELGSLRGPLRWTERGVKGLALTGVLSYADLAAGYFGFRFWRDLLSPDGAGSFIVFDAPEARWAQRRSFSFADYVNHAWDESVNCSTFHPALAREVAEALRARDLACPAVPHRRLAGLPDAPLYVNPALLVAEPDDSVFRVSERIRGRGLGRLRSGRRSRFSVYFRGLRKGLGAHRRGHTGWRRGDRVRSRAAGGHRG